MDQSVQIVDLAPLASHEGTSRLMALRPLVTRAAEADPAFEAALIANPIRAVTGRFGAAAIPNEGEFLRAMPDGGYELIFPVTQVRWTFLPATGELPNELPEGVSAGRKLADQPLSPVRSAKFRLLPVVAWLHPEKGLFWSGGDCGSVV